eukprot:m.556727 g.556727  ORF g.556727 m.556727 type:complete len:60 (+) comp22186_c0_seq6:3382-3561(+)
MACIVNARTLLTTSEQCVKFPQLVSGTARYDYTHEIRNRDLATERRISITFRQSVLTKE